MLNRFSIHSRKLIACIFNSFHMLLTSVSRKRGKVSRWTCPAKQHHQSVNIGARYTKKDEKISLLGLIGMWACNTIYIIYNDDVREASQPTDTQTFPSLFLGYLISLQRDNSLHFHAHVSALCLIFQGHSSQICQFFLIKKVFYSNLIKKRRELYFL